MTSTQPAVTRKKKLAFSLLFLLLALSGAEIALRCIFYQRRSRTPIALVEGFNSVQARLLATRVAAKRGEIRITYDEAWKELFEAEEREVLLKTKIQYQAHFASLVQVARDAQTTLLVLYLPSTDPNTAKHAVEQDMRKFFRGQAERHRLPFIDLTDALRAHPWPAVTLLPLDGRLSRFGNSIVAEELDQVLADYADASNPNQILREDQLYGDLPPMLNEVNEITRGLPFRMQTNRQGFRNTNSIYTKERQRILVLGDSFTYGLHLSNHDTWPAMLQTRNETREIINAGIPGYTITHELESFRDRSQFIAPDITILQVLDNDLLGLFLGE